MKPLFRPVLALLLASFFSLTAQADSSPTVFNIMDYGAKGDGISDDTAAINTAITAAQTSGGSVYIPAASKSYIYSSCIYFTGIKVYGVGNGSILQSSNPANSAIVLQGQNPSLTNVKIISPLSSKIGRQGTPQSAGVVAYNAKNFTIQNVQIDTTASVGIMSFVSGGTATDRATISNCSVSNTLADGIHLTMMSAYIDVTNNTVTNSGDDMYAIVSYMNDGGICHDITFSNNKGLGQSANGRGISVVGGNNVKITNNTIQNSRAAGVYLQSELVRDPDGKLSYKTYGDDSILVENNVLNNTALDIPHGGINLGGRPADTADPGQMETSDVLISNVTISSNTITSAHCSGMSLQGWFNGVHIEGNTINTTGQQGIQVFGGSNLYIGDTAGNTLSNIGQYGIYTGFNSFVPTLTSGTLTIKNNSFSNTNVLGSFAVPIISVGATNANVSGNLFQVSAKNPVSKPYIRYGVE